MAQIPFVGRSARSALATVALFAQCSAAVCNPGDSQSPLSPPSLDSVLGREVTPPKGVEGGRIIDVLTDGQGQIHAYVVEFGGFLGIGTRKIAVDRAAFRFDGRKIFINVSGEQIELAREYAPGDNAYVVKLEVSPRH